MHSVVAVVAMGLELGWVPSQVFSSERDSQQICKNLLLLQSHHHLWISNFISSAQQRKGAGVAANEVNENSDRELSCT
jgi:hypothetical protein